MPIIAIALVIAAAFGGGTAYAAQTALPGDVLWNFKTTVNENVEGLFASSDEAKANFDINVAADRLNEAQQLAQAGTLDAKQQADITANFDAHAKDVAALVAKLQAEGKTDAAAEVAARFQALLAKQADDIRATASTTAAIDIEPLMTTLRSTLDNAATLSAQTHAELRGGNAGDHPSDAATQNADANARLEGSTSASTSQQAPVQGLKVHTGTSVRGGQGGIQSTGDGSVVGI